MSNNFFTIHRVFVYQIFLYALRKFFLFYSNQQIIIFHFIYLIRCINHLIFILYSNIIFIYPQFYICIIINLKLIILRNTNLAGSIQNNVTPFFYFFIRKQAKYTFIIIKHFHSENIKSKLHIYLLHIFKFYSHHEHNQAMYRHIQI